MNILFLHHSTGSVIWRGAPASFVVKAANRVSPALASLFDRSARLPVLFEQYNRQNKTQYIIQDAVFPRQSPYGWCNYPYDYYNIWVQHAGQKSFQEEPTLEMLTRKHQVIVLKHCFPVCNIQPDAGPGDVNSDQKTLANYKLQYLALRDKLHAFPGTKFILWTGAARVKAEISEPEAQRAKDFFKWVTEVWDLPQDNIFIWDFYALQTEGGIYFKDDYARATNDSHPNGQFAAKAAQLFFNRIIDVVERNGVGTTLTGEKI